ncbi:uncharacterized protein LOC115741950 [Rhodamnia argentea]|uniref:Uncharacterized protein LOC115741950 n=1 Tax=Rhodamnia argentea TaxID=178133 RepID=A0A8B8PCV4_9MYRT|nr:uncharacterized protein LOC115741950 [Rhodamnia argentea]
MTRQIMLRPPSASRREPLLKASKSTSSSSSSSISSGSSCGGGSVRFAEVAGGTAAECAVVCCCCPCGIANLILLAVYKVPAGLCRRAWRKTRRQRLIKKGLLSAKGRRLTCGCEEKELQIHPFEVNEAMAEMKRPAAEDEEVEKQVAKLEKEMLERFYGTGFWRSPSQREPPSAQCH